MSVHRRAIHRRAVRRKAIHRKQFTAKFKLKEEQFTAGTSAAEANQRT
jgi:hypothetical protein